MHIIKITNNMKKNIKKTLKFNCKPPIQRKPWLTFCNFAFFFFFPLCDILLEVKIVQWTVFVCFFPAMKYMYLENSSQWALFAGKCIFGPVQVSQRASLTPPVLQGCGPGQDNHVPPWNHWERRRFWFVLLLFYLTLEFYHGKMM